MKKPKLYKHIIISALQIFSKKGFYKATLADISRNINMSVGNIYNYFPSKNALAKATIVFAANNLASELHYINNEKISSKEKIYTFVKEFLHQLKEYLETIEYFFKVYLAHREIFSGEEDCGFALAKPFIEEIEELVDNGVKSGEFIKHDFYISFSCIVGILGGITFLSSEGILESSLDDYAIDLSTAICKALA